MLLKKLKMEFLGTFLILYITGTALINVTIKANSLLGYGIAIFVAFTVLTWMSKNISGSHFNPIITIANILTNHMKFEKGCMYILFQLIAGIFAGSLIKMTIPSEVIPKLDDTILGIPEKQVLASKAILLEIIGSFFVVFFYYILVLEKNTIQYSSGPAMGAIMFIQAMYLYGKTGSVLNPVKMISFGLVSRNFTDLYIYLIFPILGGIVGGFIGSYLLSEKPEERRLRIKQEKRTRLLKSKMRNMGK